MKPELSICIPCLNDPIDVNETIKSIRETSGERCQIVVVDDGSLSPVKISDKSVILHRNKIRIGAGVSRHTAVERYATSDHVLLCDSHMRFEHGWMDHAMEKLPGNNSTVYCGSCLGLSVNNMDIKNFKGEYCGADLCLWNDKNGDVFEGKWSPPYREDNTEVQCLMGACYFFPRQMFLKIGGLKHNFMWGGEEPHLSLKTWLSGGEIRFMKRVRIGHKFRTNASYATGLEWPLYNKIWSIREILEEPEADFLISKLPKSDHLAKALKMIALAKETLDTARQKFKKIQQHDLAWFCSKFNKQYPK